MAESSVKGCLIVLGIYWIFVLAIFVWLVVG